MNSFVTNLLFGKAVAIKRGKGPGLTYRLIYINDGAYRVCVMRRYKGAILWEGIGTYFAACHKYYPYKQFQNTNSSSWPRALRVFNYSLEQNDDSLSIEVLE